MRGPAVLSLALLAILGLAASAAATSGTGQSNRPQEAAGLVQGESAIGAGEGEGLTRLSYGSPVSATIPTGGGSLTVPAEGIAFSFPAGAFTDTVTVEYAPRLPGSLPALECRARVGSAFDLVAAFLEGGRPAQPTQPYTVTIHYVDADVRAGIESTLALYYWDSGEWVRDPSSQVDTLEDVVTAAPDHVSLWALLGDSVCVYLPLVWTGGPGDGIDLTIDALEVTQSVQDPENGVPLVESRPAMVRVYARTDGDEPVNGVYVSLTGRRDGSPLSGSPLLVGPGAVSPDPSRGVYESSFNVLLPAQWLSGGVELVATVDSTGAFRETNEGNNTAVLALQFNPVPALDLVIVPINYTHAPTGKYFPGPTVDTVSDLLIRSYPLHAVDVSFGPPIDFRGDLRTFDGWCDLLDAVTFRKMSDGGPAGRQYYGLVPISNDLGQQWWFGGFAGIGWIGLRASAGLDFAGDPDDTGETAAHEIGHNFGLGHAPCGGASNPDPDYPYADGSIGQYGFDISRNRLWTPQDPDNTKDMMSYCWPSWWSDYHYTKLYDDQRAHGAAAAAEPRVESLLLRVAFGPDGTPTLRPAYGLELGAGQAPARSDLTLELLDETGGVVATHALPTYEAGEWGDTVRAIYAAVPLPGQPVAGLRLLEAGRPAAERSLTGSVPGLLGGLAAERTSSGWVLRWGAPTVPALVRFTADDGVSWTTVGFDLLGGELELDRATLPDRGGRIEIRLADTVPAVVLSTLLEPQLEAGPATPEPR